MIKVLFVCHGNICRSTMAEFVLKHWIKERNLNNIYVESAGTSREEIGNPVHYGTKNELQKYGIQIEKRGARQITKEDYDNFDFLIGMDQRNVENMLRFYGGDKEEKISKLLDYTDRKGSIADPWYTGNFSETYQDVCDGLEGFLSSAKVRKMW